MTYFTLLNLKHGHRRGFLKFDGHLLILYHLEDCFFKRVQGDRFNNRIVNIDERHSLNMGKAEGGKKQKGLQHPFCLSICAPRKSGKSYFVSHVLEQVLHTFDLVFILCPSIEFQDDYTSFATHPNVFLCSNITRPGLANLITQQEEAKKTTRRSPELYRCPQTLIILDDCIDSGVISFRGVADKLAERGRHIDLSGIFSCQRISAVSRSVRINSDYFMIFDTFSVEELEKFTNQFVTRDKRSELNDKISAYFNNGEHRFLLLDHEQKHTIFGSTTHDYLAGKTDIIYQHGVEERKRKKTDMDFGKKIKIKT